MAEIIPVEIPKRALFKASEVCELAKVQPYVLRSWEAEFRDLGVVRSGSTTRVYRREDVELVLRIKHLVLIEGLTLAGVRRKFEEEQEPPLELDMPMSSAPAPVNDAVRQRLGQVKNGLRALLDMLSAPHSSPNGTATEAAPQAASDFALAAPSTARSSKPSRPKRKRGAD
jgi:DNA-binding transcriptional MerR regulator